ncbi:MAG TPA: ethanolamine utilization protein EutJ [Solirubrobacter sp.]|nr:ethanolamine utilization protein EutJ [Solirubrobacter sp.]
MIAEPANQRLTDFAAVIGNGGGPRFDGPVYAGVDLGTANIVTAVVDSQGRPVAGALTRSRSTVRDGLVLDYMGAVAILREQIGRLRAAGVPVEVASAAYPPGITGRDCDAFANVLHAVGLDVAGLIDEPTAASLVLDITDGCVVDIGGGTTGISLIEDGEVVYTADEATGGHHVDLVLAGHFRVPVEEAELIKLDPDRRDEVAHLVRPVFQKMGSIARAHLGQRSPDALYLVGGTSCFPGIDRVIADETGVPVAVPVDPLLATPLGIALSCWRTAS